MDHFLSLALPVYLEKMPHPKIKNAYANIVLIASVCFKENIQTENFTTEVTVENSSSTDAKHNIPSSTINTQCVHMHT